MRKLAVTLGYQPSRSTRIQIKREGLFLTATAFDLLHRQEDFLIAGGQVGQGERSNGSGCCISRITDRYNRPGPFQELLAIRIDADKVSD